MSSQGVTTLVHYFWGLTAWNSYSLRILLVGAFVMVIGSVELLYAGRKVEHVFYESPGTDHEWQTWRRDLKDFAPRLFNN